MPSVAAKQYTYEDYAKLPEGSPYQLIDGELVMTPAPGTVHQEISARLGFEFQKFVVARTLGKVFYTPTDVYLSETNTFQPDILFIAKERVHIITETLIDGAPDLVVEILSPSTGYYDLVHKKNIYESSGVKEYWLVDPTEKTVEVLTNMPAAGAVPGFSLHAKAKTQGLITSKLLPGFQIDLASLFANL